MPQLVHAELPELSAYLPAAQLEHADAAADAYFPVAHAVQLLDPVPLLKPALQALQDAPPVLYRPPAQAVQLLEPALLV